MAESIQHKLSRVRPPRVQITYDVETGNSIVKTELAFVVGVISDLSGNDVQPQYDKTATKNGQPVTREGKPVPPGGAPFVQKCVRPEFADKEFIDINRDNFDAVLADFAPRLKLKDLQIGQEDDQQAVMLKELKDLDAFKDSPEINLAFNCLDDFKPDQLIANNDMLRSILDNRNMVRDAYALLDMNPKIQDSIKELFSGGGVPQPASGDTFKDDGKKVLEAMAAYESAAEDKREDLKAPASDQLSQWKDALGKFTDAAKGKDVPAEADVTTLNATFTALETTFKALTEAAPEAWEEAQKALDAAKTEFGTALDAIQMPAPEQGPAADDTDTLSKPWSDLGAAATSAMAAINDLVAGKDGATKEDADKKNTDWDTALQAFVKAADGKDKPAAKSVEDLNGAYASIKDEYGKWAPDESSDALVAALKKYTDSATALAGELPTPAPAGGTITVDMLFNNVSDTVKNSDEAANVVKYLNDPDNNIAGRFAEAGDRSNIVRFMIADVALMDRNLGRIIDAILHADDFQKLEASWRGLNYLVFKSTTGEFLRIKVLNATKKELLKNFQSAQEFDQSLLFKKVYEETYGTLGGSPFSCLLLDDFARTTDIEYLQYMLQVAAASHAPILTAPSSELFGFTAGDEKDTFADLSVPRALEDRFEGPRYIQWKSLRSSEDSRYLNMVMPRVLFRGPYTQDSVDSFTYNELVCEAGADHVPAGTDDDTPQSQPVHGNFLWGNAAYALMERITNAFSLYKWTAAIRGMEGGGLVEDLPVFNFTRPSGDLINAIPTEVSITDRREKELSDLGFIALCYRLSSDKAVFFGGQSVNRPQLYMDDFATANARLSARLPYMLNASRFAHYVKCIMRDKVGSFTDRQSIETFLNSWLSNYVLLSDEGSQDLKASYPLREGRVDVTEDEANPGGYSAIMFIRPHFQMEEINVSIRLVAKLPTPAA